MDKPLRFGLVGCGRIGANADERMSQYYAARVWMPYSHASSIQTAGGDLVAVCDVQEGLAKSAAEKFSVKKFYSDYREMLARESLDIISIATRTNMRSEIIFEAANKGIRGIYCEKPLANSLEEGDRLAELISKNNIYFTYGGQRRYMPIFQKARELMSEGKIGTPQEITLRWLPGALLWRHPHSVDTMTYLAGDSPVEAVSAELEMDESAIRAKTIDCDPIVKSAAIYFKSGVVAKVVEDNETTIEIRGEKGSLSIERDGLHLFLQTSNKKEEIAVMPKTSGTVLAFENLRDAVRGLKKPQYDVSKAILNQEVLFGWLYSGFKKGARVQIPVARQGFLITGKTGDRYV